MMGTVVVPSRFNGPPSSGNGGYTSGVIAAALGAGPGDGVTVTLRSPPPLDRPMPVRRSDSGIVVEDGETIVAEAAYSEFSLDLPAPVSFDAAAAHSVIPAEHIFPTCFVCGPEHPSGLRIFPAPVPGRDLFAAPWIVREDTVGWPFVWAAIDCPGGWTGGAAAGLLGRLEARVDRVPPAGERCVALSWRLDSSERKWRSGTVLHDEAGQAIACARSTWIVPRA